MSYRPTRGAILSAFVIVLATGVVEGVDKPNVVINWGHNSPDSAYVRRHAQWLQRRPFDGVVLTLDPRDAEFVDPSYWQGRIQWARNRSDWPEYEYLALMYERPREQGSMNWGGGSGLTASSVTGPWNPNNKWTEKTYARALADLQATGFTSFRFNLVETYCMAPTTEWFNDEHWAQRCHNYAMVARFARQAGLQGILFDDEEYGSGSVFNYDILRQSGAVQGKDVDQTKAKARQRGRELARAMAGEFPQMVFWTLHGYSTIAHLIESGLPQFGRNLKPSFYDGILEGFGDSLVFVDGGEVAYGYNTKEHFQWGRHLAKEEPIRMGLTKVPELHRKKVRCGFGIWPDFYGKIDPVNPQNSYFSPGRWQRTVNLALEHSDGYVWVYGEHWSWWVEGPDDRAAIDIYQGKRGFPLAYWKALEAGHDSPGTDVSVRANSAGHPARGRSAYCIDGEKLAAFLEKTESVFELPVTGWTFKLDDWAAQEDEPETFDRPIAIGKRWDAQGFTGSDTTGWYRLEFKLPEELKGRKLHFYLPDVDGSVWLSSRSCPRPQTMGWRYIEFDPQANRKPFVLTNPEFSSFFFVPGDPATVVIKVQALDGAGGILAPIQVLAQ